MCLHLLLRRSRRRLSTNADVHKHGAGVEGGGGRSRLNARPPPEANNGVAAAHSGAKSTRVLLMLIYTSRQTGSTRARRCRRGICGGYANAGVFARAGTAGGLEELICTFGQTGP